MAGFQRQVEVLLTGKNRLGPVFRGGLGAVRGFADGTIGHFKRVAKSVLNLQNLLVAGVAGMAAKWVFKPAVEREAWKLEIRNLLGDAEEAQKVFSELEKFSVFTPYQLGNVKNMYLSLERFTDGALSTSRGLKMVGDAAAQVGAPVEEVARWIGTLYSRLKNRDPFLEAIEPLNRLRVVGGELRGELTRAVAAGDNFTQLWARIENELSGAEGSMARLSRSARGMSSTMTDKGEYIRAKFADEAMPAIKEAMDDIMASMDELAASGKLEEWGEDAGEIIRELWDTLKGLANFIDEYGNTLKSLGFSYAGLKVLLALEKSIVTLKVGLAAYAAAQVTAAGATAATTKAMVTQGGAAKATGAHVAFLKSSLLSVQGALGAIALAGPAAFVGWQIGKAIGDIFNLRDGIYELEEAVSKVGAKGDYAEMEDGFVSGLKGMWQSFDEWTDNIAEKHGVGGYAKRLREQNREVLSVAPAEMPEEKAGGGPDGKDKPPPVEGDAEKAARKKAADLLRGAVENEVDRRKELYEQRADALDRLAELEAKEDHDRGLKIIDDQIEENRLQEREQAAAAREAADKAKKLEGKAKDAWEALLQPRDREGRGKARAAADETKEKAKREAALQRDLARAKDREARGLHVTRRGKDILEADKLRTDAEAARKAEAAAKEKGKAAAGDTAVLAGQREDLLVHLAEQQLEAERKALEALTSIDTELKGGEIGGKGIDMRGLGDEGLKKVGEGLGEKNPIGAGVRGQMEGLLAELLGGEGGVSIRIPQAGLSPGKGGMPELPGGIMAGGRGSEPGSGDMLGELRKQTEHLEKIDKAVS